MKGGIYAKKQTLDELTLPGKGVYWKQRIQHAEEDEVTGMEMEKLHPFEINEIKRKKNTSKLFLWCHYNVLEERAATWLENSYEVVDMEEVWQRTVECYPIIGESDKNELLALDVLRKYVLELIRSGKAIPKDSCELLKAFAENPNEGPNEEDEQLLIRLLSCLTKKQFDYFINRYYFLDTKERYRDVTEKDIAYYMHSPDVVGKSRWKGKKARKWREVMYIGYLDSIPKWFLEQIHKKGFVMGHPDTQRQERFAELYRESRVKFWMSVGMMLIFLGIVFIWKVVL